MATRNSFRSQQSADFEIINHKSEVIGKIRVKPSGVLWKPKSSHSWYGLTLEQFGAFAVKNGSKQKK